LRRLRILSSAKAELRQARRFLDTERPGYGDVLLSRFEQAVSLIRRHPFSAPVIYEQYRKVSLGKPKYSIVYSIEGDEIVIVALMHHRQNPDYWKSRI